jgi:hypothetical protein
VVAEGVVFLRWRVEEACTDVVERAWKYFGAVCNSTLTRLLSQ